MAKILLIDDDPDIRTVMSKILNKEGYDVETASRKEEALESIEREKPSLILLDVLLSGADGKKAVREIKKGEGTRHIPVIMFSGHPGAAQQFEAYGADDFIAKPFNTEILLQKLSRRMGGTK